MKYDIAFSFAGENRPFVEGIKNSLLLQGLNVFYDNDFQSELWGKDLTEELPKHYYDSNYVAIFIDEYYLEKMWTYFERQILITKHLREKGPEYILPIYLNDFNGDVPGLSKLVSYVRVKTDSVGESDLVNLLINKLK